MSRRSKQGDASTLPRWPSCSGNANIEKTKIASQRFPRYALNAPRQLVSKQTEFRIRTSVADLMKRELENSNRCIFYQRVYIVARNIILTAVEESSSESLLSQYLRNKSSNISIKEIIETNKQDNQGNAYAGEETMEGKTSAEAIQNQLSGTEVVVKEKRLRELDFFDEFRKKLVVILKAIDATQISEDGFSGLFLCMGNTYSVFMLEGTEDTIANFCQKVLEISDEYFEIMRVLLVEDRINETYFDEFIYRRSSAMNINEKFPPPTANDPYMMGQQHWVIKEKLHTICRILADQLRPPVQIEVVKEKPPSVIQVVEEEKKSPRKRKVSKKKKGKTKKTAEVTVVETTPAPLQDEKKSLTSVVSEGIMSIGRLSRISSTRRFSVRRLEDDEVGSNEDDSKKDEKSMLGNENKFLESEIEDVEPKQIVNPFALNPATFNRLLPEVQRIELVLTSKRFYFDVVKFVSFSREIPTQLDEDALVWPTPYNYLPLRVFEHMPFDVNLTFGSYDVKDKDDDDADSSDEECKDEGEGGGGEGDGKDKEKKEE